jgi:hypothetical protein
MKNIRRFVVVLSTLAIACGGLATGQSGLSGDSGNGGGGGTGGGGSGGDGGSTGGDGPSRTEPDAYGQPDGSSKDGSSIKDVALPPLDAALASLDAPPTGKAGFALIINDVVQHPMTDCPGRDWEFPPPYSGSGGSPCLGIYPKPDGSVCSGIKSVILVNTGAVDMPYIAGEFEGSGTYVPGGYPGGPFEAGVLSPGAYVNITSLYDAYIVALVGSSEPFSSRDGSYADDEGEIPWPMGVKGSGGSPTMYVAQIQVLTACQSVEKVW